MYLIAKPEFEITQNEKCTFLSNLNPNKHDKRFSVIYDFKVNIEQNNAVEVFHTHDLAQIAKDEHGDLFSEYYIMEYGAEHKKTFELADNTTFLFYYGISKDGWIAYPFSDFYDLVLGAEKLKEHAKNNIVKTKSSIFEKIAKIIKKEKK